MKKINLLKVLAVFALIGLFASAGIAEAKALKMYAPYVAESYITQGLVSATDQINKETSGKISIKVFPGGQLGSYEDVIQEVKQGTIEFGATWPTKKYDPRLDLLNLPGYAPFGYGQYAQICFSKDSIIAKEMDKILTDVKVQSIGAWPEPYACFVFAKGKRPASFSSFENKKLNLRVPGMPLYRDSAVTMGYQTLTMDLSEVWNAMQTGQVDGATGQPLESAWLIGKDIIKCIDYNRFHCPPTWIICNQELWNSFSPEEQKIVTNAFKTWAQKTLALMDKKEAEYEKKLKDYGIEINKYSDADYAKLHAELRKRIWPKYNNVFGKDFLEALEKQVNATKLAK
ncbi:MAG: TRAP transporter substrate-binding protein DctP [Synergistes jonesii]|uniref:TRAP transporter substrate-binding protein DctP n=1 Tax=Synergistes jonesii TaxID=2754 RepID=UPI002A750B08|nr:TRAP transporter substrate-binding protein DctP [Synergistes jonesii]MDY2984913.1 TRAP transporter substrate-binding protein DctP [Synergistes jonesii]